MKVDEDRADVDGVYPLVQIAHDPPKTLHDELHVLAVGIVTSDGIVEQTKQCTENNRVDDISNVEPPICV